VLSYPQLQLYTAKWALFSDGEKLAKLEIFVKISDEICAIWRTKNGIFGCEIFWSLGMRFQAELLWIADSNFWLHEAGVIVQ